MSEDFEQRNFERLDATPDDDITDTDIEPRNFILLGLLGIFNFLLFRFSNFVFFASKRRSGLAQNAFVQITSFFHYHRFI